MIYTLLTNKYGQICIDDNMVKSYVAKAMREYFPHLAIDKIYFGTIDNNLLVLTILLAAHQGVEVADFDYVCGRLGDHLYNNLGLSLKCINIGYSNYGN